MTLRLMQAGLLLVLAACSRAPSAQAVAARPFSVSEVARFDTPWAMDFLPGGMLMMRKVGVLAEAWGLPIAPHAASGLALAGRVQCSAAMGSVYQEIGVLTPPMLPDDVSAPFLPILKGQQPFRFRNGEIEVPQGPGLGLDIDEEAVNRFRVEGFQSGRGGGGGRGGAQ